jgi:hypothetical protein
VAVLKRRVECFEVAVAAELQQCPFDESDPPQHAALSSLSKTVNLAVIVVAAADAWDER